MVTVLATAEFDATSGALKFSLDLQGNSEMEHEVLAAMFASPRSATLTPAHKADELFVEFTISDSSVFAKAVRAVENRHRVVNGKPTLEQEEAAQKAAEDAQKASQEAAKKAASNAQAAQDAADERIARIASKAAAETVASLLKDKK